MLLDWHDPTTLQQARQRAEEAQRAVAMEAAAVQLQKIWRGRQARHHATLLRRRRENDKQRTEERLQQQARMQAAALTVQRMYRGYRVRRDVTLLVQLKREVEAELQLQKEQRELQQQQRQSAAVCLQSAARGWLARRLLSQLREKERVRLEQEQRGRDEERQRQEKERKEARQRASVVLDDHVRGLLSRVQLRQRLAQQEELRRKAEESVARQRIAQAIIDERKRREREEEAARIKEDEARRALLQLEEDERRRVQEQQQRQQREEEEAEHRRRLAEAELQRRHAAASTIQQAWRRWCKTKRVVEELREEIYAARLDSAVIGMQAIYRGKLARRESARLREERAKEERRAEERERLLHRVRSINATVIQTQLRVFLAQRLLATKRAEHVQRVADQRQRAASRIQACWRGYVQRRQTPQMMEMRRTLAKLLHRRTPSMTMEGRTRAALAVLSSSQSLSTITRAVQSLSVTSTLASVCESSLLPALPALFSLIRSCNRSQPHTQLLLLCLTTLSNVASHPSTAAAVYHQPHSAVVLVEQLQVYRDHGRIMRRLAALLERGRAVPGWVDGMKQESSDEGGAVVRRVEAVCELLEKKSKSERRLGRAWWGGDEQVRRIREMDDIAKRLRRFIDGIQ